ncbi:hypothetical protein JMG10_07055 [Nostoc ellipsosporum NOK]|jgi:hypothetical protein|nr:hypothetical protein [Nostoc ellipsosporum NOK]
MQDEEDRWSGDHAVGKIVKRIGVKEFFNRIGIAVADNDEVLEDIAFQFLCKRLFRIKPCQSHLTPPLVFSWPEPIEADRFLLVGRETNKGFSLIAPSYDVFTNQKAQDPPILNKN